MICLLMFLIFLVYFLLIVFFLAIFDIFFQIDSGISQAVSDTNKISMTKNIFGDGRIETALTAENF